MTTTINFQEYITFYTNLSDDIKDIHGDEYDSGSMFAYYVHKKYNLPINNDEPEYNNTINDIYTLKDFNLDNDGIYSFFTENSTEMNYFVLNVENNNLTLFSFYPGQKKMIQVKFNKNEWLENLKNLYLLNNVIENKILLYKKIYGINKVDFTELVLDKFSFEYAYSKI